MTASNEDLGDLATPSDRESAIHMLETQLESERQVSDLARYLLTLAGPDLDAGIERTLATAGALAGADRVHFVAVTHGGRAAGRPYRWSAPGIEPATAASPLFAAGVLRESPWVAQRLAKRQVVHVPCVDDLPEQTGPEREALAADGVRSYLAIPVFAGDRIEGVLDFSCVMGRKIWKGREITRLRLIAEVVAGALRGRRAEEVYRKSEERFRSLTEHAGDVICEVSESGEILYVSPSMQEMFGHSSEILNEIDVMELIHPDDLGVVERMRRRFDASRSFRGMRLRLRHRDGDWRWIEATARSFLNAANEQRAVVVVRDVSERQQARQRLEEQLALEFRIAELSRGFLAMNADQIDAGIQEAVAVVGRLAEADHSWLWSFEGATPEISGAYEWCADGVERFGERSHGVPLRRFAWAFESLRTGEVLHIPDSANLPPEAQAEREEMLRRDVQSMLGIPLLFGDRLIGYLAFETIGRTREWSNESITILRLAGEILLSALRRKRAEENLAASQMQLLQAQKMEAVGTLAGGIAHDFNNQLTVMLGNASYIKVRMGDDPNLREAMDDLTRSAEHCAQLTRSLLAFSRRSTVSPTSLSVAAVVFETRELVRPLIPSSIQLETPRGTEVGAAFADPILLQQVLVSLVVNARDAMPDGGRIAITTANRRIGEDEAIRAGLRSSGDYVEIAVCDDGMGMDEATRQRVFEPFFTTKALGQGTGLGLSAAYGIAQESGGAIVLESELGHGTTVRVLLPRAPRAPGRSDQRSRRRSS